jgi:hypothetical protein
MSETIKAITDLIAAFSSLITKFKAEWEWAQGLKASDPEQFQDLKDLGGWAVKLASRSPQDSNDEPAP